jgi:hypothetical protein
MAALVIFSGNLVKRRYYLHSSTRGRSRCDRDRDEVSISNYTYKLIIVNNEESREK